jgi:signal transduction histidine kinase
VAEQLNKDRKPAKTSAKLDAVGLNELFHQITHDIRVPVTGLKMLWPMIAEVKEEEKEEVYEYLKSSSYELFDLIENLTQLLIDYELLADTPEPLNPQKIIEDTLYDLHRDSVKNATEVSTKDIINLRRTHFLKCLEVSLSLCQQMGGDTGLPSFQIQSEMSQEGCTIRFEGPSILDPEDRYGSEIHYSLFNRAKGNSKLAGFTLLRLRNLMKMIGGTLNVQVQEESTLLYLNFPGS